MESSVEHVTVVNESSWVNPVISLAGVALTAFVSWLIYRGNVKRGAAQSDEEKKRHALQIGRLEDESVSAEARHLQQLNAMVKLGRREREVSFLRELSDLLVDFSVRVRHNDISIGGLEVTRLRQYALKMHADFSEDDDAFAFNVADFLGDIAKRSDNCRAQTHAFGEQVDWGTLAVISSDAERGAFYLLRWLHPGLSREITQSFERYRVHGQFEPIADDE